MNNEIYSKEHLPLQDFVKIGMASKDEILMDHDNLNAILCGRRTEMIKIHNLSADGIQIKELDAKMSVRPDENGKLELLLHPIYKEAICPQYLTIQEAENLENGVVVNMMKSIEDENGGYKEMVVEFDPETKEFVVTDVKKIRIPDFVNNEKLSDLQKDQFRQGKGVELADGTDLIYTGVDKQELRSNKVALVVSILFDGGLSYLVYKGIMALNGMKHHSAEAAKLSEGYYKSLKNASEKQEQKAGLPAGYENKNEQSRGYGRSGISR